MKPIQTLLSRTAPSSASGPKTEDDKPLAANPSTSPPCASSPGNGWDERHLEVLWERMTSIYGHRWTSQHGAADDGTWRKGLSDIDPNTVGQALRRLVNRANGWPPTLPEFRLMCRHHNGAEYGLDYVPEVYRPRENRPERLLTGPRDDERGKAEIQRIKELLAPKNKAPSEDGALSASKAVTTTAQQDQHNRGNS